MKASLISAALFAAFVAADTTTTAATTTTTCAAQAILDACLDTTEGYLVLCGSTDYTCLCDKYTSIMTCFANCPYDDRQYAFASSRDLYCMDASAYSTKTTTNSWVKATATSSAAHATTTTDSADASGATNGATNSFGGDDADETTTTSSPLITGGAINGGGSPNLLAALAGVAVVALV
ncbi:hypothetical protein GGR50DRAFT_432829 [Xylaria sp. CBS 124048]|nr:hypothetical protein GGR50DRAFT_432829 [Xylaria sp. CBS 124048]